MLFYMFKQVVYLQNYSLIVLKNVHFPYILFKKDIFFNFTCTLMKSYMPSLGYVIKGTIFQISDLGPIFYFTKCRKIKFEKIT